jgi:mRNA interferase MazF
MQRESVCDSETLLQGDIWWADLAEPSGSGPGFRRPVEVVQGNHLNRSRVATVICVPLTSNVVWAGAPGNVLLAAETTGVTKDSVANVSQIITIDRSLLTERVGRLTPKRIARILHGIDIVLGT